MNVNLIIFCMRMQIAVNTVKKLKDNIKFTITMFNIVKVL